MGELKKWVMSQNTQFRDSLLSSIAYCFTEAFIFLKFLQWFLKWHKWHIFVVVTRLLENLMHLDEQMSNLLYVWYPLVPKNVIIKSLVWNQFIFNIRFCQFLFCLHFIRCTSLRLHFLKIWPEIYCFPGKVLGQRTRPFAQGSCLYLIFGQDTVRNLEFTSIKKHPFIINRIGIRSMLSKMLIELLFTDCQHL